MTQEATERLIELRKRRDIIGGEPSFGAAQADQFTADEIYKKYGDAQLAAAERALVAKVVSGEFEKVGQSAAAAQEYVQRRDWERRYAELAKSLDGLDRQLKAIDQTRRSDVQRSREALTKVLAELDRQRKSFEQAK